ncbi:MAG: hypothetical protein ACI9MC_002045, partial [Kiritimatiellia bacterium]
SVAPSCRLLMARFSYRDTRPSGWSAEIPTGCEHPDSRPGESWVAWAVLLARSFGVDPLKCACGARYEVKQVIRGVWVAGSLMALLLPTTGSEYTLFPTPARPRRSA